MPLLLPFLYLCSSAFATTITIASTATPTTTLAPSSNSFSFNSGSVNASAPGDIVFQTGSFTRGSVSLSSQIIPFSFSDTITLNGVTRTITVIGQDSLTLDSDTLTIQAGTPVSFGNYTFTLDATTVTATTVGQAMPLSLSATVSLVPEPASLTLSGIGLSASSLLSANLRRRVHAALLPPRPAPLRSHPDNLSSSLRLPVRSGCIQLNRLLDASATLAL